LLPLVRSRHLELPRRTEVEIPRDKVVDYLLAVSHPVGGPKARYFESRGYSASSPAVLEASIRLVALEGSLIKEEATEWGTKYFVVGVVPAPDGNPISIGTVWIVSGSPRPLLITAYPVRRRP
jgi:filamentous hemagglutinin